MKCEIIEDRSLVLIRIKRLEGQHDPVLRALEECVAGRCDCPTNQCFKLRSFEVVSDTDSMDVTLNAEGGQCPNAFDLDKCLQYVLDKLSRK